jgi:dynein assembly factor 1, axonemal
MDKEDTGPRISDQFLKKLLGSDIRMYYNTRYLNDKLFLHYKGFRKIENLQEFTGLKVLYIEGNALEKIEGLDACTDLRCLYIQENCIKEISGIENLPNLHSINLSDNMLTRISGLDNKPKLETLLLQRNNIGKQGVEDLIELVKLEKITVLDISHNKIEDPLVLTEVLYKIPSLAVLYLQGNPVCKMVQNYRKELICRMPNLKFLDDRPVFPEDRRFAEAFARGGLQEEREERKRWNQEKEDERMRNHLAFKEMIDNAKAKKKEDEENKKDREDRENREDREDRENMEHRDDRENMENRDFTDASTFVTERTYQENEENILDALE